jgi:cytoskeletal protein CcmA (bactofilin family)
VQFLSVVGGFGMGILKIDRISENGRTHIGGKTVCEGMISSSEDLTIAGTVKGEVVCKGTVVVEQDGTVDADIIAEEAFIKGQVDGNIKAQKRVEVASSGRVKGDIESSSLSIAEGVVFEGTCHMTGEKGDENNLPDLSNTVDKGIIPTR